MYPYLGDFPAGKTIPFPFPTYNSNGASVTITGLAVTDIEVYKLPSMTQRASDAGYALIDTDGIDLDTIVGIHGFTIDTSDNTDAGFYAAGNDYTVIVSSITADSQTVNFIAGAFSLDNRGLLRPTTASRTLDVTAAGEAGLDFANVAIPDGPVPALGIVEGGTAQSATSTTLVGRAAGAVADDAFNGCIIQVFGSTQGYWQAATITDTTLSSDTFTVASWPGATPSGTITYRIFGTPNSSAAPAAVNLTQVNGSAINNLISGRLDVSVGAYQSGQAPLQPTTAGRTLDVSAGGEAGLDLANVGSPTTSLNLSGTTISTSQVVASVSGAVGSVTGAVGSVSGAVASVTGNVGGNVLGSVGSLATQAKADVNAEVVDAITVDVIADSVPSDGNRPTIAQAAYMLTQFMLERSVSGTTVTVRKPDGSTSLFTLSLNDGTSPTSITRAT